MVRIGTAAQNQPQQGLYVVRSKSVGLYRDQQKILVGWQLRRAQGLLPFYSVHFLS